MPPFSPRSSAAIQTLPWSWLRKRPRTSYWGVRRSPPSRREVVPLSEKSMSEVISPAERIEIERACEQLVYAYSRALDLGDMSGAADFFAEHGSMARPMTPDQVIQGRETIRAALLTRPKG